MKNSDMPAMPQEREWQNDMEKHASSPSRFGSPPTEGIGLTKREHFAGLAMQGLLANDGAVARLAEAGDDNNLSPDRVLASAALSIADALLAELEAK